MAGPAARAFSDSRGMLTAFAKRMAKESVVRVSRGSPFPPREPRTNPGAILADWRHTQLGEDDPTVQSGQDDATPRYTSDIPSCHGPNSRASGSRVAKAYGAAVEEKLPGQILDSRLVCAWRRHFDLIKRL